MRSIQRDGSNIELLVAEYVEWATENGGRSPEHLLEILEVDSDRREFCRRIDQVNMLLALVSPHTKTSLMGTPVRGTCPGQTDSTDLC